MQRALLSVLVFVATVLILASSTVHAVPLFIRIKGTVTKNGQPVAGMQVGVNCRNESLYKPIGNTNTDSSGNYEVYAATFDCPAGATIEVTAGPDDDGKSVTAAKSRLYPDTVIDVEMGTNIPIPEYGWLGGTIAAATGMGVIVVARRRQFEEA